MIHKLFVFLFVLFSFVPMPALAQSSAPAMPGYIQALANAGAQITYLGNDLGLDGWMTAKDGQRQYVYVTPNKEAYIVGILLDRDGEMVTTTQLDRLMKSNPAYVEEFVNTKTPKEKSAPAVTQSVKALSAVSTAPSAPVANPSSPSERLFADIQAAHWVEIGHSNAPILYAFIDPECPHCHQFIQELRTNKAYENSQIRTRFLPVGILGNESLYEAAQLLESPTPQKSFFDHLDGDEFALPVDKSLNIQKVEGNMALMQEWNLDVTPFIIYRDKTNHVKIVRGRPKNLNDLLSDIQ